MTANLLSSKPSSLKTSSIKLSSIKQYLCDNALEGQARVIDCLLAENNPHGQYAIILDKTYFHPQGGGQPSDTGWINDIAVNHVALIGEEIYHYTDVAIDINCNEVTLRIDGEKRALHSRLHTGGHLLSHIMETKGWHPIKGHHWPNEGRIQYEPKSADPESVTIEAITEICQRYIQEDHPCLITENETGLRHIEFAGFAAYPCGGTHVSSLCEIGTIEISNIKLKKGKLSIQYDVK